MLFTCKLGISNNKVPYRVSVGIKCNLKIPYKSSLLSINCLMLFI